MNLILLLLALAAPGRVPAQSPEVIYGMDDRRDVFEVRAPGPREAAGSVAAIFDAKDLKIQGPQGVARLKLVPFGQAEKLCRGEKFFDQPVGANCTAWLAAPGVVITAGHCIPDARECARARFVFDWNFRQPNARIGAVPLTEVYACAEILATRHVAEGPDYAIIRLDRPVRNHRPLPVNFRGPAPEPGTPLTIIGHPSGLPAKIAGGAEVRSVGPHKLVANLDSFAGNSGSPVFNDRTGIVEGILDSGDRDFVRQGDCFVAKRCRNRRCRGEEITRASAIAWKFR